MNIQNSKIVKFVDQLEINNQKYINNKENINLDNWNRYNENSCLKPMISENNEKFVNSNDELIIITPKNRYRNGSCFCVSRD